MICCKGQRSSAQLGQTQFFEDNPTRFMAFKDWVCEPVIHKVCSSFKVEYGSAVTNQREDETICED